MRRFEKIGGTERLRPAIHFSECTSLNGEIDFLVWQRRREMIGGAGWVRLDAVLRGSGNGVRKNVIQTTER